MTKPIIKSNIFFVLVVSVVFAITILAYSNHFNNAFHFDDSHTIENNSSIRELNVFLFFKDGTTLSSLPSNQSYRPLTTTENAIDYAVTQSLNPTPFHIHIFIVYILTCLIFGLFVFELTKKKYLSLLAASIFTLLAVNAETVNYIIQRAEITAALFVLLGLYFYVKKGWFKKTYIYLVFPLIGFFAKEMAFVFAPLLFLYILIFESNVDLLHFYKKSEFKALLAALKKTLPAILLTVGFLIFYSKMLPQSFTPGGLSKYEYFITQPWVVLHYIVTYFYPYNLSADTDWTTFKSIGDYRVILGFLSILFLIYIALKTAKNKDTKLFSFGLLWFFIALIPTSTIVPFAEVLNDHRTFIPYIGLTISVVFGVKYIFDKYFPNFLQKDFGKRFLIVVIIGFITGNAYGVYQRNKVWQTEESLWKDVTIKSPKNGRGMMNYGLALMSKADYKNAEIYFNKAAKLTPGYPLVYINLGILKNAIGDKIEAEKNFKYALQLDNTLHNCWYYYGDFLFKEGRFYEAINCFNEVNKYSPNYLNTDGFILQAYHQLNQWEQMSLYCNKLLNQNPKHELANQYLSIAQNRKSIYDVLEGNINENPTAEKYLDLSLKYFQLAEFEKCINAAKKALEINPNYAEAYNNIGIAYYELLAYDEAIKAYNQALTINSQNQLAQNNLANAINDKEVFNALSSAKEKADFYLNLSLQQYNKGFYKRCIFFANESNQNLPNANAYNNICTAYNQLGEYTKAIEACNAALKIESTHELAKGNLSYAQEQQL
jgi:tetratricopeptide (TPR) repeat protein